MSFEDFIRANTFGETRPEGFKVKCEFLAEKFGVNPCFWDVFLTELNNSNEPGDEMFKVVARNLGLME